MKALGGNADRREFEKLKGTSGESMVAKIFGGDKPQSMT
jgi:hypothetical protein